MTLIPIEEALANKDNYVVVHDEPDEGMDVNKDLMVTNRRVLVSIDDAVAIQHMRLLSRYPKLEWPGEKRLVDAYLLINGAWIERRKK